MERIASFSIDHLKLKPGIYVSRKDVDPNNAASVVTTFDIRMTAPNREPVMDMPAVHAIEHLGATYLRNSEASGNLVVYFGPMGCRTGFYLLLFGDYESRDVVGMVRKMFEFVANFEGEVPGAQPEECGNWHDSDLNMAKWYARRFLNDVLCDIDDSRLRYPGQ